ncbi:hypothetical protein NQZ79_g2921 [Umbelopsis isabellina]|nr:hypothetical protein NQZ79_g2921 [Umbelopsis isabellina]
MPVDAARAKARDNGRSLEQELFTGEEMSVNSGIERRTVTPVHLRSSIPHGNRGFSPANAQALPSRDPRLAQYQNGFGEWPAGSIGASHLAPKDIASNGGYQHQNRSSSRATTTVNNNTLTKGAVVNAQGNLRKSSQTVRNSMDKESASVPLLPVPAKRSKTGSSSNAIPLGAPKMSGNTNATSFGGTNKPDNANATPLGRPSSPASTNANSVAEPSKQGSSNAFSLDAPNISDNDIEILPAPTNVSKKRVISSGPPLTDKAQPKQQQEEIGTVKEDTGQQKAIITTPKNAALVALPPQLQSPTSSRPLSIIATTSQKPDMEEVVDVGSASMQNALYNAAKIISRILDGPYIYMSLSRFEREYSAMQVTKAPSLTPALSVQQLRANYDHPAMVGYFRLTHYPANALAKFICLPFRRRPSQILPENSGMHRLEVFDLDASYCVFPGTTINISCLMFLLNTLPGWPSSDDDYMHCTVDELFEYLAKHSAHLWSVSSYDQGNRLLLDFNGRCE